MSMTESEWLRATDPTAMLAFLRDTGRLTERKARLFAVACCRRIWSLIRPRAYRDLVEVAERFADGQADRHQVREAEQRAYDEAG